MKTNVTSVLCAKVVASRLTVHSSAVGAAGEVAPGKENTHVASLQAQQHEQRGGLAI